ncbi:MAG TPA: hypothetical protein VLT51_04700, partial [Anaerolineales bacterium]|nr:hypothetical protein [Anaerolineales bacterium]
MFVLRRNPLTVAFGLQTREQYIERTSPPYAALMHLINELPQDARIYSLFEPRSYALPRFVQPDVINSNFSHDLYYQITASGIINYWKTEGYTHILINNTGANLESNDPESQFTPAAKDALRNVISMLELVGQTPEAVYSIFKIP